jgi:hypothetical protein
VLGLVLVLVAGVFELGRRLQKDTEGLVGCLPMMRQPFTAGLDELLEDRGMTLTEPSTSVGVSLANELR